MTDVGGGDPDRAANEWLYFDTPTDSKGLRYNSTWGVFEIGPDADLLFPDDWGTAYGSDYDAAIYWSSGINELTIDASANPTDDITLNAGDEVKLSAANDIVLQMGAAALQSGFLAASNQKSMER